MIICLAGLSRGAAMRAAEPQAQPAGPVYTISSTRPSLEDRLVLQAGKSLTVTVVFDTGESSCLGAYRPFACQRHVPVASEANPGWTLKRKAKDPRWNTYELAQHKWRWLKREYGVRGKTLTYEMDTAGWAAGDYCLRVSLLFRTRPSPDGKPRDDYVARPFFVTIVPTSKSENP